MILLFVGSIMQHTLQVLGTDKLSTTSRITTQTQQAIQCAAAASSSSAHIVYIYLFEFAISKISCPSSAVICFLFVYERVSPIYTVCCI